MIRSHELAELWRAGESAALYGEPELAGAIDLFDDVERRLGLATGKHPPPDLVELHTDLATRIEAGHCPGTGDSHRASGNELEIAVEHVRDR